MTPAMTEGIRMLDPVVASPSAEQAPAARLRTLDGKVIGLYSNTKLNANKVLGMAAEIIQRRFRPARFVLVEDNVELGHDMTDDKYWRQPVDAALIAIGD